MAKLLESIITRHNIKTVTSWLLEKLLYPFKYDLPYFILLYIIISCICLGVILIKCSIIFALSVILFNYAITYIFVFFANLNKYAGHFIIKPLLLGIANLLLLVNIYCILKYHSRLPMQIIAGTNPNEIREFLLMYFSWTKIIITVLLLILTSILLYILVSKIKFKLSKRALVLMSILGIISFISVAFNKEGIPILYNVTGISNIADFRYTPTYPKIESETETNPMYIITIIGESYTPFHSSLYGYNKQTNPLLGKRLNDGELILFDKVISPKAYTTAVFMYLLNTYKIGMEHEHIWYNCTNLIEVLNTANYHTAWISNQEETGLFNNIPSGHSQICDEAVFMTEDQNGNKYDGALIDWQIGTTNTYQAVFYHLMGQHYIFRERYPKEYEIFKPSDYQDGGRRQPEILAQYDNATLYNDYVVNAIIDKYKDYDSIVFYFPDHALDLYGSDPDFYGHAKNTPESQAISKKIPFMIFLSPLYQQLRPNITKRIRDAVNKEFCTDKFIYAVMDAAGLKFADNDDVAKYSLFSYSN